MTSARKELFDKIIRIYPDLSPKKRRVADFIIKDYKKVFMMTAREIAKTCAVSEPTIMRFAVDLGFSGYLEFVQYMKGLLHMELTGVERLLKASRESDDVSTLTRYCQNAIHNLDNLMRSFSAEDLNRTAQLIYGARLVYVVGYRASATLAYYFGYLLKKIRGDVFLDTVLSWELRDLLVREGRAGLLFAIAFPRYCRGVISLLEYARSCNTRILGLSDNPRSPILALADEHILIDMEGISFIDPFAHVIAYLSALIHEITFLDNERAMKCLASFDDGVRRSHEFFTEEGEPGDKSSGSYLVSRWPHQETG